MNHNLWFISQLTLLIPVTILFILSELEEKSEMLHAAWRLDAAPAVSNLFWAKNMGSILRYPFEDVTIIRKNGATVKGDQES